jgi:CRP/FNR family transcriptional regulator/CRP/FNR family cyclic AMP-dependent transcriptional regulator
VPHSTADSDVGRSGAGAGTIQETLAASFLLGQLPAESLDRLAGIARRRSYRRGEIVFHAGDPGDSLHVLASGRVRVVVYSNSGSEKVLAYLAPGDSFGELALFGGEPRSATVQASQAAETVVLRRDDFLDVVHSHMPTLDALLATAAATIRRLSDDIGDLAFLDLEGRLAKKLLELGGRYGSPVGDGTQIELPITQEDLAAMVAASRASINKVLGWFEDRGAIQRRDRHIVITDAARLRRCIT